LEQVRELKHKSDGTQPIVLGHDQVRPVDLDAVYFLAVCESKANGLRHCPP